MYARSIFVSPFNELCRSNPSDVMSQTSAMKDGSTHVALGYPGISAGFALRPG
jgi:hypothetical protein